MANYSRDSFDRFGDDLCEEILQYIPIDCKSHLECVSRQWLRTIYKRQKHLDIRYFIDRYHDKTDNKCIYKAIKNLLKKCSFITSVSIHFKLFNKTLEVKILREIADNCPNLSSIKFLRTSNFSRFTDRSSSADDEELRSISYRGLHYFGAVCGNNLRNADFSCFSADKCRLLLKHCHNLLSLEKIYVNQLITTDKHNKYDEVYAPQLAEIKDLIIGDRLDLMDKFVMRYENTLKVLNLRIKDNRLLRDGEVESECLPFISALISLEKLDLQYECDLMTPQFTNNLKLIGDYCNQLKSLALDIYQVSNTSYNITEIFNAFNCSFTQLTHLKFITNIDDENVYLTSMLLNKCKNLTNFYVRAVITDLFFINIHIYLPKIQILSVETSSSICDKSMNWLSKLQQLKAIEIKNRCLDNSTITETGVRDVIDNCAQFKSFKFSPIPNITINTINILIDVAKQRPNEMFNHKLEFFGAKHQRLHEKVIRTTLPKNLNIIALYFE